MRFLYSILLLLTSVHALAQVGPGVVVSGNAVTTVSINGTSVLRPVPNAGVYVCLATQTVCGGTNAQPIYSDPALTQPIVQPLITDKYGNFTFYSLPGQYKYTIYSASLQSIATYPFTVLATGVGSVNTNPLGSQAIVQPSGTTLSVSQGTTGTPATGLTFSHPTTSVNVSDASPQTHNPLSHGDDTYAPLINSICQEYAQATCTAAYLENVFWSGSHSGAYAPFIGVNVKQGAKPIVSAFNPVVTDDSFWAITTCSRASNVMTCGIDVSTYANTLQVGDIITVSGNSLANTYPAQVVISSVTTSSISWASTGSNAGPISGGELAYVHAIFGLEFNHVHHIDTGIPTGPAADNYPIINDITASHAFGQPSSSTFFAPGGNNAYVGFMSGGAKWASIFNGFRRSADAALTTTYGVLNGFRHDATVSANYEALPTADWYSTLGSGSVPVTHEFIRKTEPDLASGISGGSQNLYHDGNLIGSMSSLGANYSKLGYSLNGVAPSITRGLGGAALGWNGNGTGEADLIVNRGGGVGGFNAYTEDPTTHARTIFMRVDASGNPFFGSSLSPAPVTQPSLNANHGACWKTVSPPVLGSCASAMDASGGCTCN